MAWGGQWCTSPGYAYVTSPSADAFVAEAKKALVELFGQRSEIHFRLFADHQRAHGRSAGGLIDPSKVIAGGKSDRDAHYLDPTLPLSDHLGRQDHGGRDLRPILPILTYKSFDEAMNADGENGTSARRLHFQPRQKTIERFIGQLPSVGVAVNLVKCATCSRDHAVWRHRVRRHRHYYGKYGFDALTHAKSMLISPPDVAIEHLYSPFTKKRTAACRMFEY